MSTPYSTSKPRPFSADVTQLLKFRPQSSNCPTIVKHEITSPSEAILMATTTPSEKRFVFDRPLTANTTTRLKFSTLQNFRPKTPATSNNSARPFSSTFGNTTVNFEYLNELAQTSNGKFKDRSGLKPKRKLKTGQFHNAIYKVKQQKEMLEKVSRVEDLQRTMKETNLWNTPQTAIVDSILKKNAQQDPHGPIGKFLRTEREAKLKQSSIRANKRVTDRPQSAFLRSSIRSVKTVEDFFSNDDDYDHETIEEILTSSPRQDYNIQYNSNKKKITHKINQFLDSAPTYHSIVQTTKENSSINQLSSPKLPLKFPTSPSYDLFQTLTEGDEPHQPFISEIIESPEITETTPKHQQDSMYNPPKAWVPMKSRPFSAKMSLKPHLYSPKEFEQRAKTPFNALQGKPMAIHTRPSTAKNTRFSTASNLSINPFPAAHPFSGNHSS